jgi:hypothetical protein
MKLLSLFTFPADNNLHRETQTEIKCTRRVTVIDVGGALVGAVLPFTFASIMPTNRVPLDAASPRKNDEAFLLLATRAPFHAVRTC